MTRLFTEQPLASPASANYIKKICFFLIFINKGIKASSLEAPQRTWTLEQFDIFYLYGVGPFGTDRHLTFRGRGAVLSRPVPRTTGYTVPTGNLGQLASKVLCKMKKKLRILHLQYCSAVWVEKPLHIYNCFGLHPFWARVCYQWGVHCSVFNPW